MMVPHTARQLEEIHRNRAEVDGAKVAGGKRLRVASWAGMLTVCAALSTGVAMARDPDPALRIPLEPIGYQTLASEFLLSGSSMLTVDFVDKDHLLITFGLRHLMKREVDPPPQDDDRTVGAFLVELPSGKVLAQAEWRLHDRGQYLWNLGDGRFLLRVRDHLTLLAPMAAANSNDAFQQYPFLQFDRHILAILISSDHDLLTVESTKSSTGEQGFTGDSASLDSAPVQINFYRLSSNGGAANNLLIGSAGVVRTRTAVVLPMTTAGMLDVLEGGKDRWLFNFNEHAGKVNELAEWDTTCFPHPTFVGHSEFVAFGCRGSNDKLAIAGFNLKGEEMWQQSFTDMYVSPMFVFAPAAGRFALGRTIVSSSFGPEMLLPSSVVTAQEVRVYQSYNGKQLLRIECTPVERAGQNFALSPDGLRLAVVRETMVHHVGTKDYDAYTERSTAVELYDLPPLTDKDQAAVKEAEKLAPADSGARIDLALKRASASAQTDATAAANAPAGPANGSPAATEPVPANEPGAQASTGDSPADGSGRRTVLVMEGDPDPDAPRKPPTLYGPDEKPGGNTTPQKAPQ